MTSSAATACPHVVFIERRGAGRNSARMRGVRRRMTVPAAAAARIEHRPIASVGGYWARRLISADAAMLPSLT